MNNIEGKIIGINGPVVTGEGMSDFQMREMVTVGPKKLIGEVIILDGDKGTIQVYEETEGLKVGEPIVSTGRPLSARLGPGLLTNMFDGIERPLEKIQEMSPIFIPEGIGLISLDEDKDWDVEVKVDVDDVLNPGETFATVKETDLIETKILVPPNISGRVVEVVPSGQYKIEDTIVKIKDKKDQIHELKLYHDWPIRTPRPSSIRLEPAEPLITGTRIIDTFFPLAKGGTAAIPGGFGTGKSATSSVFN